MKKILFWDSFKLSENTKGVSRIFERAIRKVVNTRQRKYIENLDIDKVQLSDYIEESIIVSMTTFPARINYVDRAIKSILIQTVRPKKIVLWLAKEQFKNCEIPQYLSTLCKYGLEIRFCEEDLLAHKKYFYSMQEYPDSVVVTYDDDLIYPENSIEKLLETHRKYPEYIICNRGRKIPVIDGIIESYDQWKVCGENEEQKPSFRLMASTGSGTLYPPRCMPNETFNIKEIRENAWTADDLWMKAMSIYGNIPVVKTQKKCKALCLSVVSQKVSLAQTNVMQKKNDEIFRRLLSEYPIIIERLKKDI